MNLNYLCRKLTDKPYVNKIIPNYYRHFYVDNNHFRRKLPQRLGSAREAGIFLVIYKLKFLHLVFQLKAQMNQDNHLRQPPYSQTQVIINRKVCL